MTDGRTRTPVRGVTRPVARDTGDVVRELFGLVEAQGAEIARVADTARAANTAAIAAVTPPRIEWSKVVSVCLVLLGGFATVVVKLDRAPDRDEVETKVRAASTAAESRARALEIEDVAAERQVVALRLAVEALERRIVQLETRKKGR